MAAPRKADGELARPRHRRGGDQELSTRGVRMPTTGYEPDESWHPSALRLYNSVKTSGSQTFYQDTDWAMLHLLCDQLSQQIQSGRPSAVMMQTILNQLNNLLLTEGDRRKVRIELHAPPPKAVDDREVGQNVYSIGAARGG